MNKYNHDIPYLDDKSIQKEIKSILANGLDKKASFGSYLVMMYKHVGFRYMFKDLVEIMYILIIASVVVLAFILSTTETFEVRDVNLYTVVFIWSPITYLLMAYLFFVNQKQKSTYEVEMTCKYNLHQLAAFRMLIFSVISMILNGVFIYVLLYQQELNYFYAILISSSSLFLFAVVFLYVQHRIKMKLLKITLLIVWVCSNLVVSYYSADFYLNFLNQIPIFVYGFIVIAGALLYVKSLHRLLHLKNTKGWI